MRNEKVGVEDVSSKSKTGVQPTSPSFTYFTPISPFLLISTSTEPHFSSLVSPHTSSFSSSSLALHTDFPSMGATIRVNMHWYAINWCSKCREIICIVYLGSHLDVSIFTQRVHLFSSSFFPFLFFFLPDSTFSVCSQ